jgi:hypothetical protein
MSKRHLSKPSIARRRRNHAGSDYGRAKWNATVKVVKNIGNSTVTGGHNSLYFFSCEGGMATIIEIVVLIQRV